MSNAELQIDISPDDKEWTLTASFEEAANDADFCEMLAIALVQFCRITGMSASELAAEAEKLESESLAAKGDLN